jgi:hypothetical protein
MQARAAGIMLLGFVGKVAEFENSTVSAKLCAARPGSALPARASSTEPRSLNEKFRPNASRVLVAADKAFADIRWAYMAVAPASTLKKP